MNLITDSTATTEAAFNKKKKTMFNRTLDINIRKKLVKRYTRRISLYGEGWTLRIEDQKHLKSFEVWCWRRMENLDRSCEK